MWPAFGRAFARRRKGILDLRHAPKEFSMSANDEKKSEQRESSSRDTQKGLVFGLARNGGTVMFVGLIVLMALLAVVVKRCG